MFSYLNVDPFQDLRYQLAEPEFWENIKHHQQDEVDILKHIVKIVIYMRQKVYASNPGLSANAPHRVCPNKERHLEEEVRIDFIQLGIS